MKYNSNIPPSNHGAHPNENANVTIFFQIAFQQIQDAVQQNQQINLDALLTSIQQMVNGGAVSFGDEKDNLLNALIVPGQAIDSTSFSSVLLGLFTFVYTKTCEVFIHDRLVKICTLLLNKNMSSNTRFKQITEFLFFKLTQEYNDVCVFILKISILILLIKTMIRKLHKYSIQMTNLRDISLCFV